MGFSYMASPYTHEDPDVRQRRFEQVCRAAAHMMDEGKVVFSAIAHGHAIEIYGAESRRDWEFWENQCINMLDTADELLVLTLDGWQDSVGVQREIDYAEDCGIPTRYINPRFVSVVRQGSLA